MDILPIVLVIFLIFGILAFLFNPYLGLVVSFYLMYNPIYGYFVINLQGFEEARIRVLVSIFSILILGSAVFFRHCINPEFVRKRTPIDNVLFFIIPFIILSFFIGVIRGNPSPEIFSAVFPILEGLAFFF